MSERTKAGLARAALKGKYPGRPKVDVDATAVARMRQDGASLAA